MKLIELKELVFPFPEDSQVMIELPDGEQLNIIATHETILDSEGEIVAYKILFLPIQNT
jgi:hypothetical protein